MGGEFPLIAETRILHLASIADDFSPERFEFIAIGLEGLDEVKDT